MIYLIFYTCYTYKMTVSFLLTLDLFESDFPPLLFLPCKHRPWSYKCKREQSLFITPQSK
jgi:hypothetical protein